MIIKLSLKKRWQINPQLAQLLLLQARESYTRVISINKLKNETITLFAATKSSVAVEYAQAQYERILQFTLENSKKPL